MIPSERTAAHPGVILLKEFLEPLEITQKSLANHLGIPVQRINLFRVGGLSVSGHFCA